MATVGYCAECGVWHDADVTGNMEIQLHQMVVRLTAIEALLKREDKEEHTDLMTKAMHREDE